MAQPCLTMTLSIMIFLITGGVFVKLSRAKKNNLKSHLLVGQVGTWGHGQQEKQEVNLEARKLTPGTNKPSAIFGLASSCTYTSLKHIHPGSQIEDRIIKYN